MHSLNNKEKNKSRASNIVILYRREKKVSTASQCIPWLSYFYLFKTDENCMWQMKSKLKNPFKTKKKSGKQILKVYLL